jgi:GAF domain-containing protein
VSAERRPAAPGSKLPGRGIAQPGRLVGGDADCSPLGQAVLAATALLNVDSVGLMLLDDENVLQAVGSTDALSATFEVAQAGLSEGPGRDSLRLGQSVAVPDLAAASSYAGLWSAVEDSGVRAVLSSPVWVFGELGGNLIAIRRQPHVWSNHETKANEAYAKVIGLLLGLTARRARVKHPA